MHKNVACDYQDIREISRKQGINSVHEVIISGRSRCVGIMKKVNTCNFDICDEVELNTLRYHPTQQAFREVTALKKISRCEFSSKNLFPELYDVMLVDGGGIQCILEEKASEGSLEHFLSTHFGNGPVDDFKGLENSPMPRKIQLSFSIRMLLAVYAMKTVLNMCHNDIGSNIMVTRCETTHEIYTTRPGCNICVPTYGFRPILVDFGKYCPFTSNPCDMYEISLGVPLFIDDFTSMMWVIRGGDFPKISHHRMEASMVEREIVSRLRKLYVAEIGWYLFGNGHVM